MGKAFCVVLAVVALAGCSRSVRHPDAAPGSFYYQQEQLARQMQMERQERDLEAEQRSE